MVVQSTPNLKKVTIASIRHELRALWAAEAMNDEAVIRARTYNMIVVVADNVAPQQTTQRIIENTSDRPGRVIVVDIDAGRDRKLDAWVTTYCRIVNGRQLCGEMITLTVGETQLESLYSVIVSLLAPDLPVYLWWMGTYDENNILAARLADQSDRVIVNLSSFDDAPSSIHTLFGIAHTRMIGDLTWARLINWRQSLAQLWDAPKNRAELQYIQTLDIHFVRDERDSSTASALLLTGWIISRLEWEVDGVSAGPSGYSIEYSKGNWHGKLAIIGTQMGAVASGEIVRISVQAGAQPPFIMPSLEFSLDQQAIETRWNEPAHVAPSATSHMANRDDAQLLVQELDLGYDPDYEAALRGATAIRIALKPE